VVEITDAASEKLKDVLSENLGKYLRIVFEGAG